MAGYSGTSLPNKLGIKDGARVALIAAPEGLDRLLQPLPGGVTLSSRAGGTLDVIVFFTRKRDELVERFPALAKSLEPDGGLWIAWPKKSSALETNLSQVEVMEIGLSDVLMDDKVCAIDDDWSGLRFVVRKAAKSDWPPA